jgi:glucose-6-phosphate isomerase
MVVLPYADRLGHLGRYLQQLVMESLGKRLDRKGREIRAGLAVYGNKGSTDQHAFVQQLRDGPDDFFATFVELLAPSAPDPEVEPGVTAGDYLSGFLLGTRAALAEDGKRSLHVALERLSPWTLGALIALFERAVGIYGELLDLNAYHQPGVEAGKRAATRMLGLQKALIAALGHEARGVHELAESVGLGDPMAAWFILRRLALRGDRGVIRRPGATPLDDTFVAAR